jgi:enediyne biosynthesis protein E4
MSHSIFAFSLLSNLVHGVVASAPTPGPASAIRFTDITAQSGIDFTMTCGKTPATEILEVNGGGMALIDFDNDGDLDLFIANGATLENPQSGPGSKLFENLGEFRFQDVTEKSKIDVHRWATGAAVGDYDGDGFDDIYVSCYGPDVLLRNAGDRTFVDATSSAKISDDRWGASAAFGDIDNDGDLDLYVTNYLEFDVNRPPPRTTYKNVEVMAGPHGLTPQHDILYENLGDGTFRDITAEANCLPKNPAFGLNVVIIDVDNDGKQDILVANDSMPDFLFHNLGLVNGRPRFEEIGNNSGIAANNEGGNQASMGYAIADVDGNGFPDKFTTVFSSDTNSLHMNLNGTLFEDRSPQYGLAMISRQYLGWSTAFYDFDHDGDEDLFMVNGHVYPEATMESMDSEFAQPPLLFAREGKRFKRVQPGDANSWLGEKHRDRNAVFGDFDGDGDIDIIIGELNGPIRVLRNETISGEGKSGANASSNWLIVELHDGRTGAKNRHGYGSKIEVETVAASNAMPKQTRWLYTGGGFQSSGAPYVHFAAPNANEATVTVTWPDGFKQRIEKAKPCQRLRIERTAVQ